MRLFCVVGEVSGDAIAAKVVQGLRRHGVSVELFGIGGPSLRKEGLTRTEVPMEWLSVMGIAEVVPALPRIWAALGKTVDAFHRCRPDVILSVDCKGFASRVLRRIAHDRSCERPLAVHVVAPTFWARRHVPREAGFVPDAVDRVLCLLPGEVPYLALGSGQAATFVGHPSVEDLGDAGGGAFAARVPTLDGRPAVPAGATSLEKWHALSVAEQQVAASDVSGLPDCGTRLAWLLAARHGLRSNSHSIQNGGPMSCVPGDVVVGTLAGSRVQERRWAEPLFAAACLRAGVRADAVDVRRFGTPRERMAHFASWRAALAVPGTVAVELALAGVPAAVSYKAPWLTRTAMHQLLRIRAASLVNLVAAPTASGGGAAGARSARAAAGLWPTAHLPQPERLFSDASEASVADALRQAMAHAGDSGPGAGVDDALTRLTPWCRGTGRPVRFSDAAAAAIMTAGSASR